MRVDVIVILLCLPFVCMLMLGLLNSSLSDKEKIVEYCNSISGIPILEKDGNVRCFQKEISIDNADFTKGENVELH